MASDGAGAGAGGRKRTRFPCLATVRYIVAAVVGVLTIVVAVKMIMVELRPEDIQLSILQGHIEASALWRRSDDSGEVDANYGSEEVVVSRRRTAPTTTTTCESNVVGTNLGVGIGAGQQLLTARSAAAVVEGEAAGDDEEDDEPRCAAPIVTYSAAPSVRLRVTLSAYNPSGRFDVNCTGTTLRVVDLNNMTGMVEIAWWALPTKGFLVRRKSSHTVTKWLTVDAGHVRSYIATAYAGKTSFKAMVQVNTTLNTVSWNKTPKNVTNGCGPVTVGLDEPAMSADPVNCRPIQVFGSVSSWNLAPAPAPAVPA